ncbi:MBL fold metallo-hydrolase, partial [Nakamurella silvestris]
KLSLQHLKAICITHVHGDHCYGLMGLLASAGMNGRKDPITIIAPKEIQDWFEATRHLTELFLPYPLHFIDSHTFNSSFELDEKISIKVYPLHHRVPSYAYAFKATSFQRKLDHQRLVQLEIPKGKLWGDLQQGLTIEWNGQSLHGKDFVIENTQHVSAIVSGDNDQPELLKNACRNVALLIHETTYTQAVLDKVGSGPMHSSAKIVAEFAQMMSLPNLIATHLSARYHDADGVQKIHDEIAEYYHGHFYIADDFHRYTLSASGELTLIK